MKHFGDITKLSGYTLPPVDCICGGSPCQDLSVAGLRKGLSGERSGLFMEQVRIAKEMRERGRREAVKFCRYLVWENVGGAFSSNGGRDFQAVLTEIIRIAEPNAPDVPLPEKGKWKKSGCLYDEMGKWSVAWRLHDAQYFGVPQRRKRISLLADFDGLTAPEIMFDPQYRGATENGEPVKTVMDTGTEPGQAVCAFGKSVSGDSEPGGETWEEVAETVGRSANSAISFQERAGKPGGGKGILIQDEHVGALSAVKNQSVFCLQGGGATSQNSQGSGINEDVSFTVNGVDRHAVYSFDSLASNSMKSGNPNSGCREIDVAKTLDCSGPDPTKNQGGVAIVTFGFNRERCGAVIGEEIMPTLQAAAGESGNNKPMVFDGSRRHDYEPLGDVGETVQAHYGTGGGNTPIVLGQAWDGTDIAPTLTANNAGGNQRMPDKGNFNCVLSMDVGFFQTEEEKTVALLARQYKDPPVTLEKTSVVRRITPLECERLQGFPDGWTDIGEWTDSKGKKHKPSDSPRYKALGNSIALPFWFWLLRRISAQYERPATMGSLFDGIGGFPLCWEKCNGKGTALWASEIEEFPIAVTKLRFPEVNE